MHNAERNFLRTIGELIYDKRRHELKSRSNTRIRNVYINNSMLQTCYRVFHGAVTTVSLLRVDTGIYVFLRYIFIWYFMGVSISGRLVSISGFFNLSL